MNFLWARLEKECGDETLRDELAQLEKLIRKRGKRLRKVRCEIPWKNLVIEIDIYQSRHAGLVVAEVEFPDRATCRKFKPPSWFGREVTGEKRYSNVRLANE